MAREHLMLRGAAAGCALAAGVATTEASAFCRGVAANAPAGYDPVTQGCFGIGLDELYWKSLCVGYSLQQDASKQVTLAQATSVADQAFATWAHAACSGGGAPSITAVDEGPVACDEVGYSSDQPNQHVIIFRDDAWPYDDSSNTLAFTTITYATSDGEILDADVEINSHDYTLTVSEPPPSGTYDLLSVLTHEAGHFLGLAHSADTSAVMYAHYQPGSSVLTADDVAGICSIDQPDGARSTSGGQVAGGVCDPTPVNGFASQCPTMLDGGVAKTVPDAGLAADAATGPDAGGGAGASASGCAIVRTIWPPASGVSGIPALGLLALVCAARRSRRRGTA